MVTVMWDPTIKHNGST